MKVCFILEHYYPHIGGAETICRGMASHLHLNGHEVRVVTSTSGGVTGVVKDKNVTVYHYDWPSFFGHPVPVAKTIEEHVRWADIIHTATYTAAPVAGFAAQKFKKPSVITAYEVLGSRWFQVEDNPIKAWAFEQFEKFVVSRFYSAYHAISHATEKDMIRSGIPAHQIETIYPGVETASPAKSLHREKKSLFTLCYFGRPGKTKGLMDLVEALKILKDRAMLSGIYLIAVVSNDPLSEKEKIKRKIQEWELGPEVEIKDPLSQQELVSTIQSSNCVVVPSRTEGFGFSAVEACTLGMPVIVSNAGSLPEVVYGNVLEFKAGIPEDLANVIVLAKKGKFTTIPQKDYSWKTSILQLENLYRKLI